MRLHAMLCLTIFLAVAAHANAGVNRADFNGDGHDDLLWQHVDGQVVVWFMQGTSVIGNATIVSDVAPGWRVAGTGDFDGDGNADIVWRNTSTGDVAIWTMTGTTRNGAVFLGQTRLDWNLVSVCDINSDSSPDLIWQNSSDGTLTVWFMNGTAYSGTSLSFGAPPLNRSASVFWPLFLVTDIHWNGTALWIWDGAISGYHELELRNNADSVSSGTIQPLPPAQWRIVASADLNGDGVPDLIWRHATGVDIVWFMKTTVWVPGAPPAIEADGNGSATLPTVPDPGWEIVGPR